MTLHRADLERIAEAMGTAEREAEAILWEAVTRRPPARVTQLLALWRETYRARVAQALADRCPAFDLGRFLLAVAKERQRDGSPRIGADGEVFAAARLLPELSPEVLPEGNP